MSLSLAAIIIRSSVSLSCLLYAAAFVSSPKCNVARNGKWRVTPKSIGDDRDGSYLQRRHGGTFFRNNAVIDEQEEDEEESGPLSRGIESVSWLPSGDERQGPQYTEDAEEFALFPLGGFVYTPNSKHVLNIFEPRYREMYNDILMNGSKRFVVAMNHPTKEGTVASVGVMFELTDLKEVSEQTDDIVKYICDHRVTKRVKLHRIKNPMAWQRKDTYLRVEGTVLNDEDITECRVEQEVYAMTIAKEEALKRTFASLVDLQHELDESVRFTLASARSLGVKAGSGEDALWETIRLWQAYTEQRLAAAQSEMQSDFQEKLVKYLTEEKKYKEDELPSVIVFTDLSPQLQKEVKQLQLQMTRELEPLALESTLTMQKILEAKDHEQRVNLVRYFVDAEYKRLSAKKVLKGVFGKIEKIDEPPSNGSERASIFTEEPDTFQ